MKFRGMLATDLSGSLDGITASRNAGGTYFRTRAIPVNPNTAQQQVVRSLFAQLQGAWSNILTPAQREAWNNFAAVVTIKDSIGADIKIQGKNWYTRGNLSRLREGLARVDDGPTSLTLPTFAEPTGIEVDTMASRLTFNIDPIDSWALETGGAMYVYISRPQSPARNFFNGPYQLAGVVLGDSVTPPAVAQSLPLPSPYTTGQAGFVRFNVGTADARQSGDFRSAVTVL